MMRLNAWLIGALLRQRAKFRDVTDVPEMMQFVG
jgi:hypothetical protein